ncbi:hypothetical protein BOTBODRAFT_172759 [Botryobasidium botryosum FD-172 SS1]|uniref:SCP domain-containing protein n=1 Tax=Botryobasidium botryosum (strain FD-172 SS1) TaxID=930990 RepID=A0A067MM54_BOTB1|nr:hypothetical protein BOTBODRAFT_172759 [Botryobasidium botryosum FD-172 SS1]
MVQLLGLLVAATLMIFATASAFPTTTPFSSDTTKSAAAPSPDDYLAPHNALRAQHGASPLTWSPDIAASALWADEAAEYDPAIPKYSHFTQMVWKSTTQMGCAVAYCDGISGPGKGAYHVCQYSPPGNVMGQFPENVQP